MTEPGPGQRLDKWLWGARFFKTRSLAGRQCEGGRMWVDGATVTKAHFAVRPGMVLTFVQGRHVRVIKVLALAERRGPAAEAQTLYDDLDPPTPRPDETEAADPTGKTPTRAPGSGRPTKRDRRALDTLKQPDD